MAKFGTERLLVLLGGSTIVMAAGACGAPEDPVVPAAPPAELTDDAGGVDGGNLDASAPPPLVASCTDVADGTRCGDGSKICVSGACVDASSCDASVCGFRQVQRVIGMKMQFATGAYCAKNALGGAIASIAQGDMQTSIDTAIADGSLTHLLAFAGDTTGTSGPATVESLSAIPVAGAGYDGKSDLDWWYTPDSASSQGALATMTGTFAGGNADLTGNLTLSMTVGGAQSRLRLSTAKIHLPIGPLAPFLVSTGGPPGHLASENLAPTLQSFGTAGNKPSSPTGELCGNVSASSLATTAMPTGLLPAGATPCTEGYTTANHALDLFVHGCHVKFSGITLSAIKATQPDTVDATFVPAGADGPYTLAVDGTSLQVNGCKDKAGNAVALPTCLDAAAYTSSFKFATDRVILK